MARFQVTMGRTPVTVGFAQFDVDQVQLAMPHACFGDDFIGKLPHLMYRALEHHGFYALIVIEMRMHGGEGQIMMGVLDPGQSFGQLALMVVVDVG
jgi:hypothetical protein